MLLTHQISIGCEVELLLLIIQDGCHGTLTHTLSSLTLRAADLLLDTIRVVMLDLLEPIYKSKKSVSEIKRKQVTYV